MHKLYWSFGEPREEAGELVCDFYYQTGKHIELRLPWPSHQFTASGDLRIGLGRESFTSPWGLNFFSSTVEAGQKLYHFLGKEAQTSLIRAFSNLADDDNGRVLCLQFVSSNEKNRERCLALEDLPWELLHDGEKFITERYSLQIIRSYTRDLFFDRFRELHISSWRILLVSPFVFTDAEINEEMGLTSLPQGREEILAIRNLETQTYGLVEACPKNGVVSATGITQFSQLERLLYNPSDAEGYHLIHFVGHGLIYDDEPCLCFEHENGGVDYVSVNRMRKLLQATREGEHAVLPSILFLNACSSSSRGRYSAGFASALHDLGICVLGYKTEVRDDRIPLLAAKSFYQSLCLEQALETPHHSPNVVTAVSAARRTLSKEEQENKPLWGSLRAYIPVDLSFHVKGRGVLERTVQSIYRFFSEGMIPSDYTDHLSIGFLFALCFGTIMGVANLTFIFPEAVSSTYLTYLEILSELARIFMVGPLSFLVASIFISWLSQKNHQFLHPWHGRVPWQKLLLHNLQTLPIALAAGLAFTVLFTYSFSSLELLSSQTAAFANLKSLSINQFWSQFLLVSTLSMTIPLWLSNWLYLKKRQSLHSYRTFYVLFAAIGFLILGFYLLVKADGQGSEFLRFSLWAFCSVLNVIVFGLVSIKMLKEISWSASRKRAGKTGLSWQKLIPLLGGAFLGLLFYFFLEESVRFEPHTIHQAILERKENLTEDEQDIQVIRVLERALKQRAVSDIPDSIRNAAQDDWLLSVICADYSLYRAMQGNSRERIQEADAFLEMAQKKSAEVQFEDYYCNIKAMVNIYEASWTKEQEKKKQLLTEAVAQAHRAVSKNEQNFAYLDTLARAEARLAELTNDLSLMKKAASHIQKAEWNAFFLRSYRASEVQRAISSMAIHIDEMIERMKKT